MKPVDNHSPFPHLPSEKPKKQEDQKIAAQRNRLVKEAEEALRSSRPLGLRFADDTSLSSKKVPLNEKAEIANRSGRLWECIRRKPSPWGGYIYQFQMNPEYDHERSSGEERAKRLQAKRSLMEEISPAIELDAARLSFLDKSALPLDWEKAEIEAAAELMAERDLDRPPPGSLNTPEAKARWESLREKVIESARNSLPPDALKEEADFVFNTLRPLLFELGYKMERDEKGVYLELPDKEALLGAWEKARSTRSELPPLEVASSEGVAGDNAFIEAYFTHDVLMSSGKEFVHDQTVHVIPTISLILKSGKNNPHYSTEKARLVKLIANAYRHVLLAEKGIKEQERANLLSPDESKMALVEVKKLKAAIGALADFSSGQSAYQNRVQSEEEVDRYMFSIWSNPTMAGYFKSRFKEIDEEQLSQLWEGIRGAVAELDQYRKNP